MTEDKVSTTLKVLLSSSETNFDLLTNISLNPVMAKTFISPILKMILKSYLFQKANLKIILIRYMQHLEKKKKP